MVCFDHSSFIIIQPSAAVVNTRPTAHAPTWKGHAMETLHALTIEEVVKLEDKNSSKNDLICDSQHAIANKRWILTFYVSLIACHFQRIAPFFANFS